MDKESELQKKKIDTAVKFLQNPRVRQTPMNQRRAFLEKKGLTKEEIEQAIALSGTAADEHNVPSTAVVPSQSGPPPLPPPVPWKGYFGAAVIGGGLGYLLVNLIKAYIMPLIFNIKQNDEKLEKLETAVAQTNASVTEAVGTVQTSLDTVQEILEEQQRMIRNLSSELAQTQDKLAGLPTDSYSVGDLKSEIVSLKGLLLNRKQFPPAVISSPQSPGIPAWQRSASTPAAAPVAGTNVKSDDDMPGKETGQDSSSTDHSHMNGHSNESDANRNQETLNSSSSSDACSPDTVKTNDSHMDKSMMNDALVGEEGDISNDTTLSSLSDMSANTSFHEASIAFSSTCIKIPSDVTSAVDDSAAVDTQEVD